MDTNAGTRLMKNAWRHSVYDVFKITLIALLLITPFRFFVAQPFIVSGASMEPTLMPHEYLVIDELSYRFQEPRRGDVIIFRYPLDPAIFFVKRVVGLPGETVDIRDGHVFVRMGEGKVVQLEEPYVEPEHRTRESSVITLEDNEYFVLGDNRSQSSDSRVWGPVTRDHITGRAYLRLFPFDEIMMLPGAHAY